MLGLVIRPMLLLIRTVVGRHSVLRTVALPYLPSRTIKASPHWRYGDHPRGIDSAVGARSLFVSGHHRRGALFPGRRQYSKVRGVSEESGADGKIDVQEERVRRREEA